MWTIYLTSYITINSKWIRDPNIRPKTVSLLVENIGEKLYDVRFSNDFLHVIPKTQEIKQK